MYYSNTATHPRVAVTTDAAALSPAEQTISVARRPMDVTDSGPGVPRGDATSADPSEASTQGAGSRSLIGQAGERTDTTSWSASGAAMDTGETGGGSGYAQISQGSRPNDFEQRSSGAEFQQRSSEATEIQGESDTSIPLFREELRVGKREVDAGTVTIRKRVETETVNEPVELRRETVSIERQPASGTVATDNLAASRSGDMQPFQEQEITIPLRREEAVVEKEVVPAGQIVAQREVQTQTTNVQGQIRRESVSVDGADRPNVQVSEDLSAVGAASDSSAGTSAGAASGYAQTGTSEQGQTIRDLATLSNASDAARLSGRQVQLNNVPVRAIIDSRVIALGSMQGQPVYAVLQQPLSEIREGDTIRLSGTVRTSSQGEVTGLSSDAAHVLGTQPFFIHATSAQRAQQ